MGLLLVTPQSLDVSRSIVPMKALVDFMLFLVIAFGLAIVWLFTHDNRDGDDE